MGRLHKLEADIELEELPNPMKLQIISQSSASLSSNQHSPGSINTKYTCDNNGLNYNNNNPLMVNNNIIISGGGIGVHPYEAYDKEAYFGLRHKEMVCGGEPIDDAFIRPPLWEDITSSIQNIDPENAMMLASLPGATQVSRITFNSPYLAEIKTAIFNRLVCRGQVKLEASDDHMMEPLSSPLLSPLEIKTEKNVTPISCSINGGGVNHQLHFQVSHHHNNHGHQHNHQGQQPQLPPHHYHNQKQAQINHSHPHQNHVTSVHLGNKISTSNNSISTDSGYINHRHDGNNNQLGHHPYPQQQQQQHPNSMSNETVSPNSLNYNHNGHNNRGEFPDSRVPMPSHQYPQAAENQHSNVHLQHQPSLPQSFYAWNQTAGNGHQVTLKKLGPH